MTAWQDKRQIGDATLYLGDCLEILPTLGKVDAVVTDPPYGTGCAPRGGKTAGSINFDSVPDLSWDVRNFDWIACLTPNCAIAAFCHPASVSALSRALESDGLLIYVKSNPSPFGTSIETIVTRNFDRRSPQHIEAYNAFNGQVHPTQKPLEVMKFLCGKTYGTTILDPFMGSGTTGVACINLGRKFIGIEIEPKYYETACKRIEEATRQGRLFDDPQPKLVQQDLLA